MSRIVGRSRPQEMGGTGVRASELIVMVGLVVAVIMGLRYYFIVYKVSPGYTLSEYIGAVKAGNVANQYALIDESDKARYYPTQKDYANSAKQAHGYTERIEKVLMDEPQKDPKDPDIVTVKATLTLRPSSTGKELYQNGELATYTDRYALRKDKEGHWKVWLGRTDSEMLKKAIPSPPGDPL